MHSRIRNTQTAVALMLFLSLSMHCFSSTTVSANTPFYLEGTDKSLLVSQHTGITHELIVSLPASYHSNPQGRYPVLYFLDGYWDMPLLYATYGNLSYDKVIPEFILVGLSVPSNVNIGSYRDKFFSPSSLKGKAEHTGKASHFYKMLTQEVIPHIERHYRAEKKPESRALAGQSMGGLFTLFSLYQKPQIFSRFIAVNPAAEWDGNYILKIDDAFSRKHKSLAARLFVSFGSDEYGPFKNGTVKMVERLKKRNYASLSFQHHELEGMHHTGGKGEAYARGLIWAFKDLTPEEKSGLQQDMGG